jgi:CubicO group peptidase (beta-lactamase class C family)
MKPWLPAFLLAIASAAAAQDTPARIARVEAGLRPPVVVAGEPGWTIDARMRHHRVPGVQVAVIQDFQLAWTKGYGLADVGRSDSAVGPDTQFQAASISKSLNATAAMALVEEGRLALDAPINAVLTSWKVPENELTRRTPVTLAQLLSHTSGATTSGFPGYVPGDPLPTLVQILEGAAPANTSPVLIDKAPGEGFRYSGGGSMIAALAIQDVTGRPYASHLKTAVLEPLGMSRSTYEQPLPLARLREAAAGHGPAGARIVGERHTYPELAAAGLWTTAADLARFGAAMQLSLAGRPGGLLKRETAARMATPVSGPAGLGFFVDAFGFKGWLGHAGGNEGFTCLLMFHREKGYGAAIMTNSENGPDLIREIMRALAMEYGWEGADLEVVTPAGIAPARLAQLAGRYVLGSDTAITLAPKGPRLALAEPLRPTVELVPVAPDTFTRTDRRVRYRFEGERLFEEDGDDRRSAVKSASPDRVPSELLAVGQAEAAREAYRRLLKARADDPDLSRSRLGERGLDLLWRGEAGTALGVLEISAELHPASALAQDALAEYHASRGETAAAARAYRKGLELVQTDPETAAFRSWANYVWTRRAEALESATRR